MLRVHETVVSSIVKREVVMWKALAKEANIKVN